MGRAKSCSELAQDGRKAQMINRISVIPLGGTEGVSKIMGVQVDGRGHAHSDRSVLQARSAFVVRSQPRVRGTRVGSLVPPRPWMRRLPIGATAISGLHTSVRCIVAGTASMLSYETRIAPDEAHVGDVRRADTEQRCVAEREI